MTENESKEIINRLLDKFKDELAREGVYICLAYGATSAEGRTGVGGLHSMEDHLSINGAYLLLGMLDSADRMRKDYLDQVSKKVAEIKASEAANDDREND